MTRAPTTCDALLEDGSKCSEPVKVMKTNYLYDRRPLVGEPATYTLLETQFFAVCPKCGDRKFVEVAGGQA
jgi:hypothetical protein